MSSSFPQYFPGFIKNNSINENELTQNNNINEKEPINNYNNLLNLIENNNNKINQLKIKIAQLNESIHKQKNLQTRKVSI